MNGTAPHTTAPRVAVVVLNFNGRTHLEQALPSLLRPEPGLRHEVLVVDNASTDGSLEFLARSYPALPVLANATNRGWPGGNNDGARWAADRGAEFVAFVNNDIEAPPGWLAHAVRLCEARPQLAVVGYDIVEDADRDRSRALFQSLLRSPPPVRSEPADHVAGTALFCRLSAFRELGGFDETLFMYADEDDFEERVRMAGFEMARMNLPVWHYGEGTAGRTIPLYAAYLAFRNSARQHLKYHGFSAFLRYTAVAAVRACRPRRRNAIGSERRMRPAHPAINLALLLAAFAWNLGAAPHTCSQGRRVRAHMESVRQRHEVPPPASGGS